jgi:hypothetical protein
MAAIAPMLEARKLLLPETAWWRNDFIAELTSFPAGAHDDWCDALSMAPNYLRQQRDPSGLIDVKFRTSALRFVNGMDIAEAAQKAGIPVEELRRWMR